MQRQTDGHAQDADHTADNAGRGGLIGLKEHENSNDDIRAGHDAGTEGENLVQSGGLILAGADGHEEGRNHIQQTADPEKRNGSHTLLRVLRNIAQQDDQPPEEGNSIEQPTDDLRETFSGEPVAGSLF